MKRLFFISFLFIAACGAETVHIDRRTNPTDQSDQIKRLQDQILALQGTSSQISGLIESDFATCPVSGSTADALINKICQVAHAVSDEQSAAIKSQLATVNTWVQGQLNAVNDNLVALDAVEQNDVATINATITTINSTLVTVNSTLGTLGTRMTNALQTAIASINASLNGTMRPFDIGIENLAAGPLYETVLRLTDKTRINAYVEAVGANANLGSNPVTASSGSSTVTVTAVAHGFAAGYLVHMQGLTSGRGFSAGDLTGDFVVVTAPTADTFTVVIRKNASSSGTTGGSGGVVNRVQGRGMGTVWKTSDGADAAARVTNLGTKAYNWIVKANGDICYSTTNNSATFAVINAGGAGVVCK
jgi:hypothetical protein